MLETYMVNWSGQVIPAAEVLVMRRVAVEMKTIYGVKEVGFVHEICASIVRFEKDGIYGAVGGLFFFGDLGSKNDQPNTADFFIPRNALHRRRTPRVVIGQWYRREGNQIVTDAYPEDIAENIAKGAGVLKITVRKEE